MRQQHLPMDARVSPEHGHLACACTACPLPPPSGCCGLHRPLHKPFPWPGKLSGSKEDKVLIDNAVKTADEGKNKSHRPDGRKDRKHIGLAPTSKRLGSGLTNVMLSSLPWSTRTDQGFASVHEKFTSTPTPALSLSTSRSNRETLLSPHGDQYPARLFDPAHTIIPIHSMMPFHLALEHLDCVRRRRGLNSRTAPSFISELTETGKSRMPSGQLCTWSSEVYYADGSFLQKQEFKTWYSQYESNSPLHLRCCPHQSLDVSEPAFSPMTDPHGNITNSAKVQAVITNHPQRCPVHTSESWGSDQGDYHQVVSCKFCHADAEFALMVWDSGGVLRYTCYTDLGTGIKTDSIQPKWRPLLTGDQEHREHEHTNPQGRQRPGHDSFEVFIHVWHTADHLGREGLNDVEHQTTRGPFTVATARLASP